MLCSMKTSRSASRSPSSWGGRRGASWSSALAAAVLAACSGGDGTPAPPPFAKTLPASTVIPPLRGLRDARGILHLHSVYSHDACDGNGLPGGAPNTECLAHLRAAICTNHLDFAMLTDHPPHFAEHEFAEDLLLAPGDAPIMKNGAPVANLAACAGDATQKVLIMAGHEGNNMSPLGLERHVDGDIAARLAFYGRVDLAQGM